MSSELQQRYQKDILPKLLKALGMKNVMQGPRIQKVVVNVGMGSYLQRLGTKDYGTVEETLTKITGQKPVLRKARMSVSNFKLRENMPVGMCVTLRGERAYDFLDKVINVVFPRVRGFRGIKRNIFDKDGNCSFGFNEHTVFPEVDTEDPRKVHGVQVTIVTNTKDKAHTEKMLEEMGFPFVARAKAKETADAKAEEPAKAEVKVEVEVAPPATEIESEAKAAPTNEAAPATKTPKDDSKS